MKPVSIVMSQIQCRCLMQYQLKPKLDEKDMHIELLPFSRMESHEAHFDSARAFVLYHV